MTTTMDKNWQDFWNNKWQQGDIGFHKDQYHCALTRYLPEILTSYQQKQGSQSLRALFPLCGKTLDIIGLKNMLLKRSMPATLVGIELSAKAIEEFFQENHDPFEKTSMNHSGGDYVRYQSLDHKAEVSTQLYCGDFFQVMNHFSKPSDNFDVIFDRAALIALPIELRPVYAAQCIKHLSPQGMILLVTVDYGDRCDLGPPFSLTDQEVQKLYQEKTIKLLSSQPISVTAGKFEDAGISTLTENIYLVSE